ncbi:MAG TPA: aspartyl/asparaginyl beta-hydroxylase domain-containing protein [Woeseiaceae bacterium]|nr:aspartyl/asparaginyl beta-hydroxylase domain-containing protein [Woeseiaceae bacterium]
MNFDGNFRRIGTVDIRPLQQRVRGLAAGDWDRETTRQRRYEAHRDTRSIGLVYDYDFRHVRATRLPALQVFEPALRPALTLIAADFEGSPRGRELCAKHGLGYFVRASLVRLNAGGQIAPHQDLNFSLAHSHRVHLPVITNENVLFTVGGETQHLREGEVVEINNRRVHEVQNGGTDGRVHLILDFVLRGEQCCCGEKRYPGVACNPRRCLETDRLKIPCTCYPEAA